MTDDKKEYILKWLEKAEHDLSSAKVLIDQQPYILDVPGFLLQQTIEKYLKSFLIYHEIRPPRTHDLIELQNKCSKIDSEFSSFDLKNLSDFAVEIRYPDEAIDPDILEIKKYLQTAEQIKNSVRIKIKFS